MARIKRLGLAAVGADSGVDYPAESDLSLICIGYTELHTDLRSGVTPSWRMWELQPYAWHPDAVLVCCQAELNDFAPDLDSLSQVLKVESVMQDSFVPSADVVDKVREWVRPVAIKPTNQPVRFRADLPHALVPSRMVEQVMDTFLERPTTPMIKDIECANEELGMPALVWRWRLQDDDSVWFEEGSTDRPRFEPVQSRRLAVGKWPEPKGTRAVANFRINDTVQLIGKAASENIERCRYADRLRPGDRQWLEAVQDVVQSEGVAHINRMLREEILGGAARLLIDQNGRVEAIEPSRGKRVPVQFPLGTKDLRRSLLEEKAVTE